MITFNFDKDQVNALLTTSFIVKIHSIVNEKNFLVICKDGFLRMISFSENNTIVWHDSLPDEDCFANY